MINGRPKIGNVLSGSDVKLSENPVLRGAATIEISS
jgi:hypothetical protein